MSASRPNNPNRDDDDHDMDPDASSPELLPEDDALEEISDAEGADVAMDSDGEPGDDDEELILQNDSIAYFDQHKDSVFAIAQHPVIQTLIATGGSEGDAADAPGKGYVIDTSSIPGRPVLPASYSGAEQQSTQLSSLFTLEGHTDSINTLAFTLPDGRFLASGGLDGRLRVHAVGIGKNSASNTASSDGASNSLYRFKFLAEAQEVPEINWIAPCPSREYPHTIAVGASDGSVWVYTIDLSDKANPLRIVQSYFLHTSSCTAGTWTPDGTLLATVAEDSSLYVWDVWGLAAAKNLVGDNGMTAVSLTGADQRFEAEGGLYSVAVEPKGAYLAVGGANGALRIVSLPRLADQPAQQPAKKASGKAAEATAGGQILASMQIQSDSIEALAFSSPPTANAAGSQLTTLLAAGSVDGSITILDPARRFAARRTIPGAHEEHSVVKLEFVPGTWQLTSCGMDGVVRRWDLRGTTATAGAAGAQAAGLVKEWRGHRGDGEGGGVLGFVQGRSGERIVTAGDDGLVLVFEA